MHSFVQKLKINVKMHGEHNVKCRNMFKQLEILSVPCQYIFSLMDFIVSNQKKKFKNSSLHNINTRNKQHLYRPNANVSCFQKRTFYAGIKIFSSLPRSLTILKNEKANFKLALRKYLNTNCLYSVNSFFMCRDDL